MQQCNDTNNNKKKQKKFLISKFTCRKRQIVLFICTILHKFINNSSKREANAIRSIQK